MIFEGFPKMARLNRDIVITEKLDGTNAQVYIADLGELSDVLSTELESKIIAQQGTLLMFAGSRTKIITPGKQTDNYGFAGWVQRNSEELFKLGPGRHFGEWWGGGIQRGYGLKGDDKRFSLFNVGRWNTENIPQGVRVVPVLYRGKFSQEAIDGALAHLRAFGSQAVVEYYGKPEGIVIYHEAAQQLFKITLEHDEVPKGVAA